MRGSKRLIVSLLPAGLCLILGSASRSNPISQDAVQLQKPIQHDVSVVNIEVPVRVFKGDTFIDHLTIGDFEVFDDGVLQQIDAVYLIKKTDIKREEAKTGGAPPVSKPQLSRQFVLFFEMTDYLSELDQTLDYFFDNVILPGDSLIVITPMKNYQLRSDALAKQSKKTVKEQLRAKVRSDIIMGSSEYKNIIDEMYRAMMSGPGSTVENRQGKPSAAEIKEKLRAYSTLSSRLEGLRRVNEKGLLDFAGVLKSLPGQKYVYMFYQKETVPQYNFKALLNYMLEDQDDIDLMMRFNDAFLSFNRDIGFNVEAVKKVYSNSGITIHFLFLTKTPSVQNPVEYYVDQAVGTELTMIEKSEDIYSAFSEVAKATGGIIDASANAAAAFQRAVNASENYYLLYFKPSGKSDGRFHNIVVKVKSGNYRVTHRAGYIAE
jgi:hypothetical protein